MSTEARGMWHRYASVDTVCKSIAYRAPNNRISRVASNVANGGDIPEKYLYEEPLLINPLQMFHYGIIINDD